MDQLEIKDAKNEDNSTIIIMYFEKIEKQSCLVFAEKWMRIEE